MNTFLPAAYEWHRNPTAGHHRCELCNYPSRMGGQHRRMADDGPDDHVWVRRRKSAQGWEYNRIGSRQAARMAAEMRIAREVNKRLPDGSKRRHSSLVTYFYKRFVPARYQKWFPGTFDQYRRAMAKLREFFGHEATAAECDDALVNRFREWLLAQGAGAPSARAWISCVMAVAQHARERRQARQARPAGWNLVAVVAKAQPEKHDETEGSLLGFFVKAYRPQRLAGCTQAAINLFSARIRQFGRWLGRTAMLTDLTDETVSQFLVAQLEAGLSRETCNDKRASLVALWRFAHKKKLVAELPTIDKLKVYRQLPVAWTLDELSRLLDAAAEMPGKLGALEAGNFWPALILTLYDTGLRFRAIFSLERGNLDLTTGWLVAPAMIQKQKVEQRFLLTGQTLAAIQRIWEPPRQLLFPWPYRVEHTWRLWRKLVTRAGLPTGPKEAFHKMRRTCATYIAAVAGIDQAARQLGHSAVDVTARYVDPRIARARIDGAALLPRPTRRIEARPLLALPAPEPNPVAQG